MSTPSGTRNSSYSHCKQCIHSGNIKKDRLHKWCGSDSAVPLKILVYNPHEGGTLYGTAVDKYPVNGNVDINWHAKPFRLINSKCLLCFSTTRVCWEGYNNFFIFVLLVENKPPLIFTGTKPIWIVPWDYFIISETTEKTIYSKNIDVVYKNCRLSLAEI